MAARADLYPVPIDREMVHQAALRYEAMGWAVELQQHGTKIPMFEGYLDRDRLNRAALSIHLRRRDCNIAFRLWDTQTVVFDKDAASRDAYNFLRKHRIKSDMEVESSRGIHVYMRLDREIEDCRTRIRFLGMPLDILMGRRLVTAPPSWNAEAEWRYRLRDGKKILPPDELPVVPESILELLIEKPQPRPICTVPLPDERAMKYMDKVPPSIQGQGGSRQCIIACLKALTLTEGDTDRAFTLVCYWNRYCDPPWDEEAEEGPDSLKRKLREARKFWRSK
jgi:hypothetical protein